METHDPDSAVYRLGAIETKDTVKCSVASAVMGATRGSVGERRNLLS